MVGAAVGVEISTIADAAAVSEGADDDSVSSKVDDWGITVDVGIAVNGTEIEADDAGIIDEGSAEDCVGSKADVVGAADEMVAPAVIDVGALVDVANTAALDSVGKGGAKLVVALDHQGAPAVVSAGSAQRGPDQPPKQEQPPPRPRHRPCPLQLTTSSHATTHLPLYHSAAHGVQSAPLHTGLQSTPSMAVNDVFASHGAGISQRGPAHPAKQRHARC
jgi:hypothetical protein